MLRVLLLWYLCMDYLEEEHCLQTFPHFQNPDKQSPLKAGSIFYSETEPKLVTAPPLLWAVSLRGILLSAKKPFQYDKEKNFRSQTGSDRGLSL